VADARGFAMTRKKKSRAERAAVERRRQKAAVRRDAAGRVHLELQRDPASGRPRLSLTEPVFEAEWQNELVTATANTALGTLTDRPSVARAVELAQNTLGAASGLSEHFLARAPAGSVACRAGCDHCCHQVVALTPPEALAVAAHVKSLPAHELERITERVRNAYERGRGLSTAERYAPEHPCPFLEAGQCSIYEVRPLACRGMNSRDDTGCERALRDPDARAEFFASAWGGHSYAEPIRAALALSAGLQLGVSEVYRLDMRPLELTAAVHLLLSGSASLPAQWLAGQMPFESARASDETNSEKMRALAGMLEPIA
jgi:Fe-S-cluster containining protein